MSVKWKYVYCLTVSTIYSQFTLVFVVFFSVPQALESGTAPLRSGNLSALKKRWEQAGTRDQDDPPSAPAPGRSISRSRPHTFTRPPVSEPQVKSPGPVTDRGGRHTANRVQQASAAPEGEDQSGMEKDEMTHSSANEKLEQQVPTSPCASYEKPRVPLNNLKMKFEKGDEPVGKVEIFCSWYSCSSNCGHCGQRLFLFLSFF